MPISPVLIFDSARCTLFVPLLYDKMSNKAHVHQFHQLIKLAWPNLYHSYFESVFSLDRRGCRPFDEKIEFDWPGQQFHILLFLRYPKYYQNLWPVVEQSTQSTHLELLHPQTCYLRYVESIYIKSVPNRFRPSLIVVWSTSFTRDIHSEVMILRIRVWEDIMIMCYIVSGLRISYEQYKQKISLPYLPQQGSFQLYFSSHLLPLADESSEVFACLADIFISSFSLSLQSQNKWAF